MGGGGGGDDENEKKSRTSRPERCLMLGEWPNSLSSGGTASCAAGGGAWLRQRRSGVGWAWW